MRIATLFLLAIFSLTTTAKDLQRTVVFDFTNPLGLSTPVTPSEGVGGRVPLNFYSFEEGVAFMTFSSVSSGLPPYIITTKNSSTGGVSYCLGTATGSRITIQSSGDATIDAITFEGTMGGLSLEIGQPGAMSGSFGREWSDTNHEHPKSVTFLANGHSAQINTITVKYTEPVVVLSPQSSNIENHGTIPFFKSFSLTFDRPVYANYVDGISMTYAGKKQDFSFNIEGNVVTLSVPTPLIYDGQIDISFPPSCFRDTEAPYSDPSDYTTGYESVAMEYTFTVKEERNTFNYLSVTPETGEIDIIPPVVLVKFGNDVEIENNGPFRMLKDGVPQYRINLERDAEDHSVVRLISSHNSPITDYGVWTIEIPEKAIHNPFLGHETDDRWNPAFTLTYTITPPPVPDPVISELYKFAKSLIENEAYKGLGYPTATSSGRQTLEALINENTETNDSIDSLLTLAVAAFYQEREIELPESDKWYTIQGVNDGSKSVYLSYSNDKISLTTNAAEAVALRAERFGDEVVFATVDGKYLHVLTNSNAYEGTTPTNLTVSDEPRTVNKLKFTKLTVDKVDVAKTFGKFAFSGLLGFDGDLKVDSSTVAINYSTTKIVDVPVHQTYFNDKVSSAFILKEAKNPTVITPVVELTPTNLEDDNQTMQLIFTNVQKVRLSSQTASYFVNSKGNKVNTTAASILTSVVGSDNTFTVHVNGLDGQADAEYYELVLPANTFNYSENELAVVPTEFRVRFHIKGYNYNYNSVSWFEENEREVADISYIADTDLNSFTLCSYVNIPYTALIPDVTKQVRLKRYYTNETIRTGHFEPYPEFSKIPGYEEYQAIRLVLDSPIEAGELDYMPGLYAYSVPKGTYGDLNFGKYLSGDRTISKSDCIANSNNVFLVQVDNEKAKETTGIQTLESLDSSSEKVVYDLQGRRLSGALKPGIYIVGNKKYVIR